MVRVVLSTNSYTASGTESAGSSSEYSDTCLGDTGTDTGQAIKYRGRGFP
jgi:hypothetical protein